MAKRSTGIRQPEKGIVILGEGITEQFYFKHLKNIRGFVCSVRPHLFGKTSVNMLEKAIQQLSGNSLTIICVFDADVACRNAAENKKLAALRYKYRNNHNVILCDSLPTIEYWFLLHFLDTCPNYNKSLAVVRDLKKHIRVYEKSRAFLENEKWVRDMAFSIGSMDEAMVRAERYGQGQASYSRLYLAIRKLRETIH
ncbi:MAG: RloB family protein [Bacteroidota bacterium]